VAVNKITLGFGAEFTLDFPSATAAAAVLINPTMTYAQDGGGFGSGLVVNHSATYQGDSGATRFIGPIFTFVHQPTFRANGAGAVVTQSQGRDSLTQPLFRVFGGATSYTMTGTWTQFFATGQVLANATVTTRRIFYAGELNSITFAGTVTDCVALEIDNLTPQTTNPAVGILNNIASPGIQYEGSTGLWGVFGATPVGQAAAYTPTNVTPDRSYNANATTLDELADVVGTLIADLQAYGWLA
jgi:hypothetical protein